LDDCGCEVGGDQSEHIHLTGSADYVTSSGSLPPIPHESIWVSVFDLQIVSTLLQRKTRGKFDCLFWQLGDLTELELALKKVYLWNKENLGIINTIVM
jgi:hypothetical protein